MLDDNVNTQLPGELYFSDNVENFEKNLEMNLLLQGEKGQDGLSKITATDVTSNICCSRYVDFISGQQHAISWFSLS